MTNALLKFNYKIIQEWANDVLTPIHTVAITPNRTVVQGCAIVVCMDGCTNNTNVSIRTTTGNTTRKKLVLFLRKLSRIEKYLDSKCTGHIRKMKIYLRGIFLS